MMKSKPVLISAAVAALAFATFFFSDFFMKVSSPSPASPTKAFHSKYGFTVRYPEDWVIDNSESVAPAEFIREPNGRAVYSMQAHTDPRLTHPEELQNVYKDPEDSLKNDERYLVEESGWEHEEKNTADNSYFAAGSYAEGGKHWRFKEVAIMSKTGNVLVLRGMSLKEYAGKYGPMLDKIFASVMPTDKKVVTEGVVAVTREEALAKIKNLPEVKEYEQTLTGAGKKATTEVEDQDDAWGVHVFEVVLRGPDSHTATFGWYRVNKQTGAVEREI